MGKVSKILVSSIIILILFVAGVTTAVLTNAQASPSIISVPYPNSAIIQGSYGELLKGEKIRGKFNATQSNLGIISVRFTNFNRINDDSVIFRIKNSTEQSWYYTNRYTVAQFQNNKYFTFGFPVLADSRDKIYQFEIESKQGEVGNSIGLSRITPTFLAEYQYSFATLKANKVALITFLVDKVINNFTNTDSFFSSLVFFLPLLLYVVSLIMAKLPNKLSLILKGGLLYAYLLCMILDVIFLSEITSAVQLTYFILWILIMFLYKFDNTLSFCAGIVTLIVTAILLMGNLPIAAENIALFAYLFLTVALFQLVYESVLKPKNLISYQLCLGYMLPLKSINSGILKFKQVLKGVFRSIRYFFTVQQKTFFGYVSWTVKIGVLLIIVVLFSLNILSPMFYQTLNSVADDSTSNNMSFSIRTVEPLVVHYGDTIVIYGNGLKGETGRPANFMSTSGEFIPSYISDNMMRFTIPLNWKQGEVTIYAQKTDTFSEKKDMIKTNAITILLADRVGLLTWDDLAYFHQIRYLDSYTQQQNNFRNYKYGKWVVGDLLRLL